MNYPHEVLFGSDAQLILTLSSLLLVVAILGFIFDENTSPQVVILVGVTLVSLGCAALWYVENMQIWISGLEKKGLIRASFVDEFKSRSNLYMLIFPFVSAAIGTNLISDVYTKKLHYNEPLTIFGILKSIPEFLNVIFGFFVILPIVAVLLPFIFAFTKTKSLIPRIMNFLSWFNRRVYLNLLKLDIIFRNSTTQNKNEDV